MPWRDPNTVALTRIDVVSQIPSASGVYAIFSGEVCLLVGEGWNLKARLLELMSVLHDIGEFRVVYELCLDDDRLPRKQQLSDELLPVPVPQEPSSRELPGIRFRNILSQ